MKNTIEEFKKIAKEINNKETNIFVDVFEGNDDLLIYFFDKSDHVYYSFSKSPYEMLEIMKKTKNSESFLNINFDGDTPWDVYKSTNLD